MDWLSIGFQFCLGVLAGLAILAIIKYVIFGTIVFIATLYDEIQKTEA